jgi:aspartyl-tRNA(Asn)/glutamyl-tRNA(Gln) amidotransferase subunit A
LSRSDYGTADAVLLRGRVVNGERSVREGVEEAFARIAADDDELGCFLQTDEEGALARADDLDRRLAGGEAPGPLFGVPLALKSNMCLEGAVASCGSRLLEGWRAPYTATFVQRLLDAGCVPVGMTNMDEFAMGSSGENSAVRPTRNPWDTTRTPGGSSSGSAAAVAAGMVPLALGSDTGGSVRQPAALVGVSGFKPTWGRVSRYGLVAFASSLDQVSPLARSARDLALVLAAISGEDERDATCAPLAPVSPWLGNDGDGDLNGLRVGVLQGLPEGLDPAVAERVEAAVETLVGLGAVRVPVTLPHLELAIPTYYVLATAEASSNLSRFDGVRFGARADGDGTLAGMIAATREAGFGKEVKRRILLGTYALSSGYYDAWYEQAARVRRLLRAGFERAFEDVDVIALPTSPTTAFELGERTADPVSMYLSDVLTVPASLAGLPAASVPAGFADGLPVGLQLIGPALEDARVLGVAEAFQRATEHHLRGAPQAGATP